MADRCGVILKKRWDGFIPTECCPHPSIYRLSADLVWEPARDPLHSDVDPQKTCGVGPGMAFANHANISIIGLVPCAVVGTTIKEWARGESLYEMRAKKAVEGGDEIKAVLRYQGENDTFLEHDANLYKGNMERLIENLRADLGSNLLLLIQVAIALGDGEYMEKVGRPGWESICRMLFVWMRRGCHWKRIIYI